MIAAVYSWIWYRRHCTLLNEGKTMSLYSFICNIASGLIEVKAKVGRPLGKTPPQCKRAIAVKRPANDDTAAIMSVCQKMYIYHLLDLSFACKVR
jgi:hypothetical protein